MVRNKTKIWRPDDCSVPRWSRLPAWEKIPALSEASSELGPQAFNG